jgi:hypothetical protein
MPGLDQAGQAGQGWPVQRQVGGVDRADRGADQQVRLVAGFQQGAYGTHLQCAPRPAATQGKS